jgi:uncharacterized protein (DUF2384 family)
MRSSDGLPEATTTRRQTMKKTNTYSNDQGKRVNSVAFGYQAQVYRLVYWANIGPVFATPGEAWDYLDSL